MKISVLNKNNKLESTLEWNEETKILIFCFYCSNGTVEIKKIVEGCKTFEKAKNFLKL